MKGLIFLAYSSTLKIEAIFFSEMSADFTFQKIVTSAEKI
jgi:hypothetical protein